MVFKVNHNLIKLKSITYLSKCIAYNLHRLPGFSLFSKQTLFLEILIANNCYVPSSVPCTDDTSVKKTKIFCPAVYILMGIFHLLCVHTQCLSLLNHLSHCIIALCIFISLNMHSSMSYSSLIILITYFAQCQHTLNMLNE